MILEPRFHGNGFIQVYLNDVTRLHIWSPEFPATRVQNAQIHDHRFYLRSKVLLGELKHTVHRIATPHFNQPEMKGQDSPFYKHGLWQQGAKRSDKSTPLEKIGICSIVDSMTFRYRAGTNYGFGGPGQFHETHPADGQLTVTVMTKVIEPGAEDYLAKIVCLGDEDVDHAFENQPPEYLLRAEVRRVMELLT